MSSAQQQYALVTGATSGIGYELARLLAQDQYNLVIVARDTGELDRTSAELRQQFGVDVIPVAQDLSQREAAREVYQTVQSKGITLDVLVNNAGQGEYGLFVDTDLDRELDIIQLNISAYVALTKFFLKEMVAHNHGKILNVASVAGKIPGPWQAVYHATKAFVLSFTEAIRNEVKESEVTITALLPGPTDTDFFHKASMESSKIVQEGSLADPAQVAQDGYKALMDGDSKVISGFKNKAQVAASNFIPDSMAAENMGSMQEPSQKSASD
ncbi:SDR family oxidoreductase [Larkinella harenae]